MAIAQTNKLMKIRGSLGRGTRKTGGCMAVKGLKADRGEVGGRPSGREVMKQSRDCSYAWRRN